MDRRKAIDVTGRGLSVAIAAIATWLMLQPGQPDTVPHFPHLDKIAHAVAFFFIALPALSVRPKSWKWIVLVVIAFGGAIEIIQPYFERGREFADFLANAVGALAAVPVGRWLSKRWQLEQDKGPQNQ